MSAGGRRWGWHRLHADWADRLVDAAGVRPGELVLDLGAGTGALTNPLVRAGARVIAVELHPGRAARLRERFVDEAVRVVETDLLALPLPRRPFRVVANPPYAIAVGLVRRLLGPGTWLTGADLILPHWLVARYAAGRGHDVCRWGQTHLATRGWTLPRHAMTPPPPGQSAVLVLRRRGGSVDRAHTRSRPG